MTRTLPFLCLLFHTGSAFAQCGYQATLRTTKDYCLGSSLVVSSAVPMERIVWYRDGQPVDSALANQSMPSSPILVKTGNDLPDQICSDDAGNIYFTSGFNLTKRDALTGDTTNITSRLPGYPARICVDHEGNIYVANSSASQILRYPGDTVLVTGPHLYYNSLYGEGLQVDCRNALYIGDPAGDNVTKWTAGSTTGQVVAGSNSIANNPLQGLDAIAIDSDGNVFVLTGFQVLKYAPGDTSGVIFASWPNYSFDATDFWMDGKDTMWMAGWDGVSIDNTVVVKFAPGDNAPREIHPFPPGLDGSGRASITEDPHGNIYVAIGTDNYYFEWPRTSSIDSAFTPADTGAYYAIVTNMQGYAARTKTILINDPLSLSGPPSIQIGATATSSPICTPITFTASVSNPGYDPSYQWLVSGVPAGGDSTTYSYDLFANGDQVYCILTSQAGCSGPVTDTSNTLTLNIDPHGDASVKISTPKDSICEGDTAIFKAAVTNAANNPVFQWLINGDSTGDISDTLSRSNLATGDVITCLITSDDACGLAKSNSIPVTVSVPPTVESGQIFTVTHGHSLTLRPVTTGDIDSWLWTPPGGLSDSVIANPIASPDSNTLYTLKVTAPGGCSASGTVLVNVYIPVSIPGAFTPNGDGHNDRFFVLGGPVNSRVELLAVFDRLGACVFRVHGVAPGDPTFGWDGTFHGDPAPAGTYVYMVAMQFANGARQVYKGTLVLVR